jgi:hypothetical protein
MVMGTTNAGTTGIAGITRTATDEV